MKTRRIIGILLILASGILGWTNVFTGAVIGASQISYLGFIALVLLITGFLLILNSKKKLEVFVRDGKYEGERLVMTDPELYFSKDGFVNLKDFRQQVDSLKQDPELIKIVQNDYEKELYALRDSDDESTSRAAENFLKVLLGSQYQPRQARVSSPEFVSKEEEQEIRNEFDKGWKNKPNPAQSRVLRKYGMDYESGRGGGHGRIYSVQYPGIFANTSSSPRDSNAGRSIGREVIRMIKEARKKKS